MAFVLSLFCLGILGYSAIAYLHLSFGDTSGAHSIPYFIVRQRTALSALAMAIAISCVIMGVAIFMIGAKGEINFKAESSWAKGALVSGVPGPFFVLCGTVITLAVLFARVSYDQGTSYLQGAPISQTEPSNAKPETISRTIASSATQRIGLYTTQTAIFNDLMSIAVEDHAQDSINHLITNEEDLSVVMVDWDDQSKRPAGFQATQLDDRNTRVSVSEGYLFVLAGDTANSVKALLKAAESVKSNFPAADHLPDESISRVMKAALGDRVVFSHGDTAH
jgi:hypothetical protein